MQHTNSEKPSTFSHIGRHILGLSLLQKTVKDHKYKKATLIGSGCIEPITTGLMVGDNTTIEAFDRSESIIDLLRSFLSTKKANRFKVAETCQNVEKSGKGRENKHFTQVETLQSNINRLNRSLKADLYTLDQDNIVLCKDIQNVEAAVKDIQNLNKKNTETDTLFLGALLINLRKIFDKDKLKEILTNLSEITPSISGSLTPNDMEQNPSTLELLSSCGHNVNFVCCEDLAFVKKTNVTVARGNYAFSCIEPNDTATKDIIKLLEDENSDIKIEYAKKLSFDWQKDDDYFPVLAIKEDNEWKIWKTKDESIKNSQQEVHRWSQIEDHIVNHKLKLQRS